MRRPPLSQPARRSTCRVGRKAKATAASIGGSIGKCDPERVAQRSEFMPAWDSRSLSSSLMKFRFGLNCERSSDT